MPRQARLDDRWIREGLLKLGTRFSNLLFFETEDPERYEQFLRTLAGIPGYADHLIYQYDRWDGLRQYNRERGKFDPVKPGQGDRYAVEASGTMGLEKNIKDPDMAFRHVDREMKRQPAILLIKNLEIPNGDVQGPNEVMVAAYRAWAMDPEMAYHRSAVICFCAGVSMVADDHTLRKAVVVKVDLGREKERAFLVMNVATKAHIPPESVGKNMGRLVQATAGLNLHQIRSVLMESLTREGTISPDLVAELKVQWLCREDILDLVHPGWGFERVGGYREVKNFIQNAILKDLQDTRGASRWGTRPPRGILLFGPPGTGKTLFAKAMAGATHMPFMDLKTENLFSRYLGDSGKMFSRAIDIAEKNAPGFVFVDEIDSFGSRRESSGDSAGEETRRVFNQILQWLGSEERRSILVGATNRPQDLDEALLREGRLDYKIPILYPDEEARRHILAIHLGLTGTCPLLPVPNKEFMMAQLDWLVERTENFSGAELMGLTQRIRRNGFMRGGEYACTQDFQKAVNGYAIDHQKRIHQIREYEEYARKFANDAAFMGSDSGEGRLRVVR